LATDYKNKSSLRADDLRRRREEQQVEIRRQKREENVSKRRNLDLAEGPESDDEGSNGVSSRIFICSPLSQPRLADVVALCHTDLSPLLMLHSSCRQRSSRPYSQMIQRAKSKLPQSSESSFPRKIIHPSTASFRAALCLALSNSFLDLILHSR
jgi:hypothetical protein